MSQRKLKIARISVAVLFALVASLLVMTACAPKAEQCTIEWDTANATHLIVSADGFDELPTSVDKGTSLSFTVSPDSAGNYAVDTVKRGTTTMQLKNGKYTYTVNNDVKFTITEKKVVKDITATPASGVTFLAGDTVESGDLVVTVNYKDGSHDTLNWGDYSIQYQGGAEATCISLGDTSVKVTYEGKEASVTIPAAQVQIVLDAFGGKFSEAYLAVLAAREDFVLTKDIQATGDKLTITYGTAPTANIPLPTSTDITKGSEGDYDFLGWKDGTNSVAEISSSQKVSMNLTATYKAHLVTLSSVELKLEEETESDAQVPYLIIKGNFKASTSIYLFLHEGNDDVDLKGTEAGDANTKSGDEFTIKFDLRELVEKEYKGKWMDIRIRADIDGRTEDMDIDLNDYPDSGFVDLKQSIHDDTYTYDFKVHTPDDTTQRNLKVEYVNFVPAITYSYTMTVAGDNTATPTVTFAGTVTKGETDLEVAGKYVRLDFWVDGGSDRPYAFGLIGDDGSFSATFELTTELFLRSKHGYAHIAIVDKNDDTATQLYPVSGETNFESAFCTNLEGMTNYGGIQSHIAGKGVSVMNTSGERFYIAVTDNGAIGCYTQFTGFDLYGDVALKVDNVTTPTRVFYVVTVKSNGMTKEALEGIVFGNVDSSAEIYTVDHVTEPATDYYRLWFDITDCNNTQLWSNLYFVKGTDDAPVYDRILEIKDADSSTNGLFAIVSGKKYTIRSTNDDTYYNSACVVVGAPEDDDVNDTNKLDPDKWDEITEPEPEPDYSLPEGAQFELTAVTIEGTDSAAYYVVSGTFSGCTADQIKGYLENAYYFDFQRVGGDYARYAKLPRTVTAADGAFTMKIDVTSLDTNRYGTHYGDENTNFTLSAEAASNATKVTVGNKIYEMVNVPGSNKDDECWGTVGLWVQPNIVIPAMTFSDMTVELETDQSKLYYTITITFTDADADDTKIVEWLKSITLEDTGCSKSVAKHVKVAEKKYKVYFDVSDYSGTQLWPHIKYMGNGWDKSNGDVKCGGSGSVSFNGKTYYYEDGWGMPTMKVS